MASTIDQAFVQQWDTAVRAEAAQRESRLMSTVHDRGGITGESFTINFLGDDGSLLDANSVRHGDTEWSDPEHATPIVNMSDFYKAYPLDRTAGSTRSSTTRRAVRSSRRTAPARPCPRRSRSRTAAPA
jgi:hypothetical protein